ncbi:MAG: T9SS type A sorting domain-containing protein [candidate division WOR-3 bacterium]
MKLFLIILFFSLVIKGYPIFNTDSAYFHLKEEMDKYHKTFDVYTDMDAGGNHYLPTEIMNSEAISLTQTCTLGMYSGITCIKAIYFAQQAEWAGVGWYDSLGYDLTGAETCSFWAKGENGGEVIRFEVGGPYDSIYRSITVILSDTWQKYYIDLRGGNLRNLKRGFCFVAERTNNPSGCTFYLDDIKFDLARLDSLRLIHTYLPLFYRHDQKWALNQAYTYPNVLAMLAFMKRRNPDDIRRARIIGDAFVFAQNYDRFYQDGRLRNAYRTGDIKDHHTGKALLPGWWDDSLSLWCEDKYQVGTYTGEMAWLILSWLIYDSITQERRYLSNAIRLGNWIADSCYDSTGIPGYTGGFEGFEQPPESLKKLRWKSTEHNLDLYVAFTWLFRLTQNPIWQIRGERALNFVKAMWDSISGYFWCGTKEDGTIDTLLVLDAQTWGLIATCDSNRYRQALVSAENNCRRETLGYKGFCFSERGDGIWWEGTGQMICAYQFIGQYEKTDTFLNQLRIWQRLSPYGNNKGIVACHPESSYTGINRFWGPWYYFPRLDIGATSWYIFAENRYNPFWNDTFPLPPSAINKEDKLPPKIKTKNFFTPFGSKFLICLPEREIIKIKIYSIKGDLVAILLDKNKKDTNFILWNGTDKKGKKLPSGIYFISIISDKLKLTEKIIIKN